MTAMKCSVRWFYVVAVLLGVMIAADPGDVSDAARQHGFEHPAVIVHVPVLECECTEYWPVESSTEYLHVTSSSCKEGGQVDFHVAVRGLVPGFEYELEITWTLEDDKLTHVWKSVVTPKTDSYTLREPLIQQNDDFYFGMLAWDGYKKGQIEEIGVTVRDMFPGLTTDEARIGIRNIDSSVARLKCGKRVQNSSSEAATEGIQTPGIHLAPLSAGNFVRDSDGFGLAKIAVPLEGMSVTNECITLSLDHVESQMMNISARLRTKEICSSYDMILPVIGMKVIAFACDYNKWTIHYSGFTCTSISEKHKVWSPYLTVGEFHSYSWDQIDLLIIEIFMKYKKNGFFVEVGAQDGVGSSNTVSLERCFGWKGILVEASCCAECEVKRQRPNSLVYPLAISPCPSSGSVSISSTPFCAGYHADESCLNMHAHLLRNRSCSSIAAILTQNNVTYVDFISIDIEGFSLFALKSIDFELVKIAVILVELNDCGANSESFHDGKFGGCMLNPGDPDGLIFQSIRSFLAPLNYTVLKLKGDALAYRVDLLDG